MVVNVGRSKILVVINPVLHYPVVKFVVVLNCIRVNTQKLCAMNYQNIVLI